MSEDFEPEVPENDDIVGVAVKGSLALFLVVGLVVGGWLVFRPQQVEEAANDNVETDLPDVRQVADLEIPEIPFTDVTKSAGVDFVHENGAAGLKLLPETMGAGGAFVDYDNDGDPDIVCVNSCHWPDAKVQGPAPTSALYENDGTGTFRNVTSGSGLNVTFYGAGIACGDYDNDGLIDLYFTAVGKNRLFRNLGQGKFTDVTEQAGVAGSANEWGTSCGWFDYDRDGDLDLFVCNYIEWTREKDLSMEFTLDGTLRAYGRPTDFRGASPKLYRNDGEGKFSDVSAESGIQILNSDTDEPLSKSLGVIFPDINSDGWPDVVIANDTVQNLMLINQKDGTFIETAAACGVAYNNKGKARGAMGIDAGYFRNSDAIGITIGNFANEMTALYVCQTPGMEMPLFRDEAVSNGVGPVTRVQLTFGVMFADMDNDGRLDIVGCNGHLEEDISVVQESQQYKQPPQLLWNCGMEYDNEFTVTPAEKTGADFAQRMVGRGASIADMDGDGDLDLLLFASGGRPHLLRNEQTLGHHWLRMRLEDSKGNRNAIGAVVTLTLPDETVLTRAVAPTASYQSQREFVLTFGLGNADLVKSVTVTWPDDEKTDFNIEEVDRLISVKR